MNKLLAYYNSTAFGNKDGSLYPFFEDLDAYRTHFIQRKKEIEELIWLLQKRVEAEQEYS
jgi:hypothetical protein